MQLLCHKYKPDNLTPLLLLEVIPLLKCHLFSSKKVKLIIQSAYSNVCCVYRVHVLFAERLSARQLIVQRSQFAFVCMYVCMHVCICMSVTL